MLDATLYVQPSDFGAVNIPPFQVLKDGERCVFPECTDGILAIPEDYKLDLRIKLYTDDDPELKNIAPRIIFTEETYTCKYDVKTQEGYWYVDWESNDKLPHEEQPFRSIPGRHEIKIIIGYGTVQKYEFSFFVDVLARRQSVNEIKGLLDAIDDDYDEIDELCLQGKSGTSSFIKLIDRAEEIEELFRLNWNEFIKRIRKNYEPSLVIKPDGIPNSAEAIYWMSAHPESLSYCLPEERHFVFNNLPVRSEVVAEEVVKSSGALYENLVIAGFFEQIAAKISDLLQLITKGYEEAEETPLVRFASYVSYRTIVREYSLNMLSKHEERLKHLKDCFFRLFRNLKKEAGITEKTRPLPPKITPFVARNRIYREFFVAISDWYALCKEGVQLNDFACHFLKLDKLYEFTVLTKIVHAFQDIGFVNKAREWHNMSVKVFGGEASSERPSSSPFNYYRWTYNEHLTIELWYEPRIYTIKNARENDLVVVKSEYYESDSYYLTPDFVFKLKWDDKSQADYFIMDAKHSSDKSVEKNYVKALTEKYLNSVHVRTIHCLQNPIKAIWALYARGEDWISGYGVAHSVLGANTIFPSIMGVLVDTKSTSIFKDCFMALLGKLNTMHTYEENMYLNAVEIRRKANLEIRNESQENNAIEQENEVLN